MRKKVNWLKSIWLKRIACVLSIAGVLFCLLLGLFQIGKNLEIRRLHNIAELSSGLIASYLQIDNHNLLEDNLAAFSSKYSIDAVELFKSDGTILTAYGVEGDTLPESFLLGNNHSKYWPLRFRYQHSRIFLHEGKPLGFLILYSSLGDEFIFWTVSTSMILTVSLAVFFSLLYSKRGRNWGQSSPGGHQKLQQSSLGDGIENLSNHHPYKTQQEEVVDTEDIELLKKERDTALASARAKGDFLANMSHEIRTSMNGVVGILSLLQQSKIEGEKRRLLDAAARSADSLLLIINDILDFSKIEAGKIDFENISFDLREVVEESIALFIDSARAKNIGLHCYIPIEIPTKICGDPTRLRQILTNLLSNAVKFTEEGQVNLGVTLLEAKENRQRLLFTVEDTGIGIPAEKIDHIFTMFNQAESSTTRKYGGSGLGLNVCKQLVELQNGEVGVRSRQGHGASFWFSLDFSVDQSPEADKAWSSEQDTHTIALFDPCETCNTIISQYLKGWNVLSLPAENAEDIILHLNTSVGRDEEPLSLLIDYESVDAEFETLMENISEAVGEKTPRIFFLTRRDGIESKLKNAGIAGIIHKPVRLVQLSEEIAGLKPLENKTTHSLNTQQLEGAILLVDDEQINQFVGKTILAKLGLEVDIASSGNEALERLSEKDYDIVLMDLQMPGLSGIETTREIREREKDTGEKKQVIIAVTANALSNIREECMEAGMDDFIAKPIKPDVLLENLRPWLADRKIEKKFLESTVGETDPEDFDESAIMDLAVWDREQALGYVGGDEKLLNDLMKLFLERKSYLLDDIDTALAQTDGEAVSNAAHAFKGAVNHFAAQQCQKLALLLELKAGRGWFEGIEQSVEQLKNAADTLEEELRVEVMA